jgi:hypothetical protein
MQPSVPVKRLRSCQVDDATNDVNGLWIRQWMDSGRLWRAQQQLNWRPAILGLANVGVN